MASRRSSRRGDAQDKPTWDGNARNAKFCIELGLAKSKCCSGCVKFADAANLLIDDGATEPMKAAIKMRLKTHSSKSYTCSQLWKKTSRSAPNRLNELVQFQKHHIKTVKGTDPRRLEITNETMVTETPRQAPAAATEVSPDERRVLDFDELQHSEVEPKMKKRKEDIKVYSQILTSHHHEFLLENIPETHRLVHKST
jgi:hypothetical protein